MANPHLKLRYGSWWAYGSVNDEELICVGMTISDALHRFNQERAKIITISAAGAREQKALAAQEANFEAILAESHRIVMAEVMRIGKKVLPVILALVAGFLIGRLYG